MSYSPDVLWSPVGLALPTAEFLRLFQNGLATAKDDEESIWKLCGAACDYLRLRGPVFQIPRELALRLLGSTCSEHRVIALKATRYMGADSVEQLALIADMMESSFETDRCVALYQLGLWIEDTKLQKLPESIGLRLRHAIEGIALRSKDQELRQYANARLDQLSGFGML